MRTTLKVYAYNPQKVCGMRTTLKRYAYNPQYMCGTCKYVTYIVIHYTVIYCNYI